GGPADLERHAGDLGNIEIGEAGQGHLELSSDIVTLGEGANSVIGKGVILHAGEDDLVSQPTGAAGARLACGVIQAGS
ncbi:MAG: superoxide dismutase family protein, partial [Acidobacteriota bacterium]|nr:superoxide dismutase family protein [Acidobacteriota bacterium]